MSHTSLSSAMVDERVQSPSTTRRKLMEMKAAGEVIEAEVRSYLSSCLYKYEIMSLILFRI